MSIVDLLELICCFWVVRILVRVELQRQFPVKRKAENDQSNRNHVHSRSDQTVPLQLSEVGYSEQRDASPVRSLNIISCGQLFNSQHVVERLTSGGQRALPLLLSHDVSRPQAGNRNTQLKAILGLHVMPHKQA